MHLLPSIKKNFWGSRISSAICLLLLLLLVISHLPFLSADAQQCVPFESRGSWSDEGIYTIQIRNFINHGSFSATENDAFLKSPLLSAFLIVPFYLAGTEMEIARFSVLATVTLSLLLFFFNKSFRLVGALLILTTLLSFPVYQYSHLSLAELCSCSLILIAALLFVRFLETEKLFFLRMTVILLSLAVLFKLQFLYVLLIPSLCIFVQNILERKIIVSKQFLISVGYVFGILILFFVGWYLPFKNSLAQLAGVQSGKLSIENISVNSFKYNLEAYFFSSRNILFTACFLLSVLIAVTEFISKKIPPHFSALLLFSFFWFVLESHKLPMNYLPIRYLISFYFSMGVFTSVVFAHLLSSKQFLVLKLSVTLIVFLLFGNNLICYTRAFQNRTYTISNLNRYFASQNLESKVVIGNWAAGLTWKSKSLSYPVINGLLAGGNPFQEYKPTIVVSEPDEDESGKAFNAAGINLNELADSVRQTKIANWNINIYWMNQEKMNAAYPEK